MVSKDATPEKEPQTICNACQQPIKPDEPCYQLRDGWIENDGVTFLPKEDAGYYHQLCLVGLP